MVEILLLLLAFLAIFILFGQGMVLHGQHRTRQLLGRRIAQVGDLQAELQETREAVAALGAEMEDLKRQFLSQAIPRSGVSGESGESSFAKAQKLAQEGHDVDLLVKKCGITRAEAELMVAMHRG